MPRILLLLLLTASISAHAAPIKRVSVQELEQILAAAHGQSDGKIANELAGVQLTERASSVRLARWQLQLPGKRGRTALTMLADAAAFLDLPVADIPAAAPPDLQTQKAMLHNTLDYVNSTITRLPDFYATRRIQHFEDMPAHQGSSNNFGGLLRSGDSPFVPLRSVGSSSTTISYVAGNEMLGSKKARDFDGKPSSELTSRGEFGPILIVVLLDAVKGKIFWKHWEEGADGSLAVFRYSVPQRYSSYQVVLPHGTKNETLLPAYHGEIAVDPATGAILRITVIADLPPPDKEAISSILVEYGPVSIGGKSYICPVHSIALARIILGDPLAPAILWQTQLNDVAFVDYHHFHAEARILTDAPIGDAEPPAPPK